MDEHDEYLDDEMEPPSFERRLHMNALIRDVGRNPSIYPEIMDAIDLESSLAPILDTSF